MIYKHLFLIFVLSICIFTNSCTDIINEDTYESDPPTQNYIIITENSDITQISIIADEYPQIEIPYQKTLNEMVYPEWICLSENFWLNFKIYSPIDHDYNKKRLKADFIDSFASEFAAIWRKEMDFQYNKCIENISEEYKEKFVNQQLAWEEYFHNDVFPEIAMYDAGDGITVGYGYVREAQLIYLDRIRSRTIEIMRIQPYINGIDIIEFDYESIEE